MQIVATSMGAAGLALLLPKNCRTGLVEWLDRAGIAHGPGPNQGDNFELALAGNLPASETLIDHWFHELKLPAGKHKDLNPHGEPIRIVWDFREDDYRSVQLALWQRQRQSGIGLIPIKSIPKGIVEHYLKSLADSERFLGATHEWFADPARDVIGTFTQGDGPANWRYLIYRRDKQGKLQPFEMKGCLESEYVARTQLVQAMEVAARSQPTPPAPAHHAPPGAF